MHLWQWAFFEPDRFQPDPAKDAAWNRGAYLVHGARPLRRVPHAAHLLRRARGGPRLAGAQLGKEKVPNITGDPEHGLGKWSAGDIVTVLKLGMLPDGDFVGSEMAKVVNNGTGKLPDADVAAIATYLKSLPPA